MSLNYIVLRWIVFSLELEASPEEGQQLQQKDKKKRRRKGEKKIKLPKILKFGFLCM